MLTGTLRRLQCTHMCNTTPKHIQLDSSHCFIQTLTNMDIFSFFHFIFYFFVSFYSFTDNFDAIIGSHDLFKTLINIIMVLTLFFKSKLNWPQDETSGHVSCKRKAASHSADQLSRFLCRTCPTAVGRSLQPQQLWPFSVPSLEVPRRKCKGEKHWVPLLL